MKKQHCDVAGPSTTRIADGRRHRLPARREDDDNRLRYRHGQYIVHQLRGHQQGDSAGLSAHIDSPFCQTATAIKAFSLYPSAYN